MNSSNEAEGSLAERLSRIETHWSRMFEPGREILRYYRAVYRYFMGIVRQADVAEELTQRFAERFMSGDFQHHADQDRGPFRNFLKTCLRRMAHDLWRQQSAEKAHHTPLPGGDIAAAQQTGPELDGEFDASCRSERLAQAWKKLAELEAASRSPYFSVLRLKTDHPEMRSTELSERLSAQLGTPVNAEAVRQILHRARAQFADLLLDEVLHSLPPADHDRLEDELVDLQLLEYCKSALAKRRGSNPK